MMNTAEKLKVVSTIVFLSCLVTFSPADAKQTAGKVDCGANDSLQATLDKAVDGDVFEVLGECNEIVVIRADRITLRGLNGAKITGPDPNAPAIVVRGHDVLIEDFNDNGGSISGGGDVISVVRNASVTVDNCLIQGGTQNGILVSQNSYLRLLRSDVLNNGTNGISVRNSSSADVFFSKIDGNASRGILVSAGAAADMDENEITNNDSHGIEVRRTSHIRLGGDPVSGVKNLIEGNGGYGVQCVRNSSIRSDVAQDFGTGNTSGNTNVAFCSVSGTLE